MTTFRAKRRHASRAIIRSDSQPISHNAMVVLAVMATWADPEAAEPVCFKEQESIARRAKISTRAVRTALTELERAGAIKRLGIVGGHALKRGTVRWGLIMLNDDSPFAAPRAGKDPALSAPRADKQPPALSAPHADKAPTPAPRADKEAAPRADKEAAPRADNSNQNQSDPKGATDDDDSAAPARPGSAEAPPAAPAAVSKTPAEPDAWTLMVMRDLGMTAERAGRWIEQTLGDRKVSNRAAYLRAAIDRQRAAEAESAAKPAAAKPAAAKPAKAAKRQPTKRATANAAKPDPDRLRRAVSRPVCGRCFAEPTGAGCGGLCTECWRRVRLKVDRATTAEQLGQLWNEYRCHMFPAIGNLMRDRAAALNIPMRGAS